MDELLPGLWRWTVNDAGCVAYEAERALVLIDPLVVQEGFLDDLVDRVDKAVSILQTTGSHARSREALERRYADRLAPEPGPGVDPVPIAGAGETMVWLAAPRALVPGDGLVGDLEAGDLDPAAEPLLHDVRLDPAVGVRLVPGGDL